MSHQTEDVLINAGHGLAYPPRFDSPEDEQRQRKQCLAAACRLFGKLGFEEGVAGHISARDPLQPDHFWVNPMGLSFTRIRVSDLLLVNHRGQVVSGSGMLNAAAFTIHSAIHRCYPAVHAAAHTHSMYGKSWSSLGRLFDPITQDSCAFYEDHVLFDDYTGVVLNADEGERIAGVLEGNKAAILRNHGLLTVGASVEAAAWWFIAMERSCQAQLLAEAAGTPVLIEPEHCRVTREVVGSELAGWFSFQPLLTVIGHEQPDLFE